MAEKKPTKSAEKTRTNTGHRGSRKIPQDAFTLIIAGKGLCKKTKSLKIQPYAGTYNNEFGSFNMAQARLNRELGLC